MDVGNLESVTGCTKVSPGCDHCYAETFAERWRGVAGHPYEQGFDLKLHPDRLDQPLRWKRPRLIFTNSMSDLFHRHVPDGFVTDIWRVMGLVRQHTFQILTKRADRMERWVRRWADKSGETEAGRDGHLSSFIGLPPMPRGPAAVRDVCSSGRAHLFADMIDRWGEPPPGAAYPLYGGMDGMRWWPVQLPNVWLGV